MYKQIPAGQDNLYGLIATFDESGKAIEVSLDGACGLTSMEAIMKALGFQLEFVAPTLGKLVRQAS